MEWSLMRSNKIKETMARSYEEAVNVLPQDEGRGVGFLASKEKEVS